MSRLTNLLTLPSSLNARNHWLDLRLSLLRHRVWHLKPNSLVRCCNYKVRITDGPNYYIQYKDLFVRQIYRFRASRANPFIIDAGSNIGLSILYFKRNYPGANIIGFEPDPDIFKLLKENVGKNAVHGVTLINAALGAGQGMEKFMPDGKSGGRMGGGPSSIPVHQHRLSNYLDGTVDFLKLNIEGNELSVLREAKGAGRLRNVCELALEYHGQYDKEQELSDVLQLLDQEGFRYIVHDFDSQTCSSSKPPFVLTKDTTWFCLVYARRFETKAGCT